MADLRALRDFAEQHDFGLTRPLTHAQVRVLAEYWWPDARFHFNEKFHPIALDEVGDMIDALFGGLAAGARDQWRVPKLVRDGATGVERTFDPPVVHVPDGLVFVPAALSSRPAVRVIGDGADAEEAMDDPEVDAGAVMTHGASFERSDQFFGARVTLGGGNQPAANDPFMPRAEAPLDDPGDEPEPRITVMASYKNLMDLLKYELLVEQAGADYPPDGLRGGFAIRESLFRGGGLVGFPADEQREALLHMIAEHEAGRPTLTPPQLPPGWSVDRRRWDAVTRMAFLEYDFLYPYNDFDRVQTTPFENEHEGDNEGCCLVFDRRVINVAAAAGDDDVLRRAVPAFIVTSVHEESQDADLLAAIPAPIPPANDPDRLPRDDMELVVYVAWASHATYLTPGDHDLVDFGDTFGTVGDKAPILLALAPGLVLALALIVSIIDHFVDTEDKTSDEDGTRTGPPEVVEGQPGTVRGRLITLPMSAGNHIYRPANEELLRLHAFPGKWGGHAGFFEKSPRYTPKTGRYFRKLMDSL